MEHFQSMQKDRLSSGGEDTCRLSRAEVMTQLNRAAAMPSGDGSYDDSTKGISRHDLAFLRDSSWSPTAPGAAIVSRKLEKKRNRSGEPEFLDDFEDTGVLLDDLDSMEKLDVLLERLGIANEIDIVPDDEDIAWQLPVTPVEEVAALGPQIREEELVEVSAVAINLPEPPQIMPAEKAAIVEAILEPLVAGPQMVEAILEIVVMAPLGNSYEPEMLHEQNLSGLMLEQDDTASAQREGEVRRGPLVFSYTCALATGVLVVIYPEALLLSVVSICGGLGLLFSLKRDPAEMLLFAAGHVVICGLVGAVLAGFGSLEYAAAAGMMSLITLIGLLISRPSFDKPAKI